MNILREVRRVKQKSLATRIRLLLSFSVVFIMTTYAWWSTQKNVNLGGIRGKVTAIDVSYFVNEDKDQILNQAAIFTIDDLYPGMPEREELTHIYNLGENTTNITYEIKSVKLFGQEVIDKLDINTIRTEDETIIQIFSPDNQYPFEISYSYDKDHLVGKYEEGGEFEDSAHATCKFKAKWEYTKNGTQEEILEKDLLDTYFGKGAYEYYKTTNNTAKAIEIQVKITSEMIHPSIDEDYPY